MIQPDAFQFLGAYPVADGAGGGGEFAYTMGLAIRRVEGQPRALLFGYHSGAAVDPTLYEFALPATIGQPVTVVTGVWRDIWTPFSMPQVGAGDEYSMTWESTGSLTVPTPNGRLWTTHATDYPDDAGIMRTQCLSYRTLNPNGTIQAHVGEHGFEGIGARASCTGIACVPHWFQTQYRCPAYVSGFGCYTSRMAQGLPCSMGLEAVAFPDLLKFGSGPAQTIPKSEYHILADHESGTTQDDYNLATGDRGWRNPEVLNGFDAPSKPGGPYRWLSPAPDGHGRWVWGDGIYGGAWIDLPGASALVCVGSFARGHAWYQGSTLWCDQRHAELQIFDPADFAASLNGRPSWLVQPRATRLLTPDLEPLGLLSIPHGGNNPFNAVGGVAWEPVDKRLYLWCPQIGGGYQSCIAVYSVAA